MKIFNIFDWCYGYRKGWNKLQMAHESGKVVASHIRDEDDGTYTRSYDVKLSTGETGTATSEHASSISVQEFWLKTPAGERHVTVRGKYNPVWDGDPVTLIWCGNTEIAYVNLRTRRQLIISDGMDEVAGRPRLGGHLLWCFVVVPVGMVPLFLLIRFCSIIGLRSVVALLAALYLLSVLADAFWTLFGFPILLFLYNRRRRIVTSRVEQTIRSAVKFR